MLWEQFRSHARALLGQHFPGSSELSVGDRVLSGGCG